MPLVDAAFAQELAGDRHWAADAAATLTTVRLDDPAHYGRVVRDEGGHVARIVEYRDAGPVERAIDEINVGLYVFRSTPLRAVLEKLSGQTPTRASSTSPTSCTC